MMMAPSYAMPMAPAQMGNAPGLGGSSVSVPTSSSSTSVEVRGPSLLGAGLARVGQRLTQLGRTRVRTVQDTVLNTPQSQPIGGTATIATFGGSPRPGPRPSDRRPAPGVPARAPTPSPQGGPPPKRSIPWFDTSSGTNNFVSH